MFDPHVARSFGIDYGTNDTNQFIKIMPPRTLSAYNGITAECSIPYTQQRTSRDPLYPYPHAQLCPVTQPSSVPLDHVVPNKRKIADSVAAATSPTIDVRTSANASASQSIAKPSSTHTPKQQQKASLTYYTHAATGSKC